MRELFASVVYQSLNSSGVELIQVALTVDELDLACEKLIETKANFDENDIIAEMIGIRAPYAGDTQFVKLFAVVGRVIFDMKSGNTKFKTFLFREAKYEQKMFIGISRYLQLVFPIPLNLYRILPLELFFSAQISLEYIFCKLNLTRHYIFYYSDLCSISIRKTCKLYNIVE